MARSMLGYVFSLTSLAQASLHNFYPAIAPSDPSIVEVTRRVTADSILTRRDHDWENSTTFSKSWANAPLLQLGAGHTEGNLSLHAGINIVCIECYLKGTATGELHIADNNFNISQTVGNLTSQFKSNIENLTSEAEHDLKDFAEEVLHDLDHFDWTALEDIEYPTFNYSFDLAIPPVPQANLRFNFDGLELFMLVDTALDLATTYNIPLFNSAVDTPETLLGWYYKEDLNIGLVFKIDLILKAEGVVDVSSGFHLRLNDGFGIDIALFDNDVSHINYNGGHFEFLPVHVQSAEATFSAILQLSVHAGIDLVTPSTPDISIDNHSIPSFGGGLDLGVFANIAEFITEISDTPECELGLGQSYVFAMGASAGATMHVADKSWGPAPSTSVGIYTTSLATCAVQGTSRTTAAASLITSGAHRRQDMSTATITTKKTFTGVNCLSTGLVDCPVSLQNTSLSTTTSTTTIVVPSGIETDDLSWPVALSTNAVAATVAFSENAVAVPATSGSPKPYTAAPTSSGINGVVQGIEDQVNGVSKKTIIGVSLGVGIPVLIAIISGIVLCAKRRSRKQRGDAVPQGEIEDEIQYAFVEAKHGDANQYSALMGQSRYTGRGIDSDL